MTGFKNRRQHWTSPFSVGVTNVQQVAFLSLRFILKKLMNSALMFCVAPVARIFRIRFLKEEEYPHLNPVLLPVSPLYYDRLIMAAAKADAGYARAPIIKIFGGVFL